MLAAARRIPGVPHTPPFLVGFSQGGHACLATLAAEEAAGRAVGGVAAVAGPHNLRHVSLGAALAGGAPSHSLYLSYMVRGYCARYGRPMQSALTESAAALTERLYGKLHKPDEILAALPRTPRSLFVPEFLQAFDTGGAHWLLDALAANEVSHFTPRAPVRLYYGRDDRDVVPREATQTAAEMRARGADIAAIDVGPYGHDPSLQHAAPQALAWLGELDAASPRAASAALFHQTPHGTPEEHMLNVIRT
jgi:pimeloyl-ACP methyl ester carboxylesterase